MWIEEATVSRGDLEKPEEVKLGDADRTAKGLFIYLLIIFIRV